MSYKVEQKYVGFDDGVLIGTYYDFDDLTDDADWQSGTEDKLPVNSLAICGGRYFLLSRTNGIPNWLKINCQEFHELLAVKAEVSK